MARFMNKHYWCVRMNGGRYAEAGKLNSFIAIGWKELDDLSWLLEEASEEEALDKLKDLYRRVYIGDSEVSVGLNCGQVLNFIIKMRPNDIVVTPSNSSVFIGEIISDYYYEDPATGDCAHKNRRKVEWKTEVERSDLPERLKSSLFAWQTVFSLDKRNYEIDSLLGLSPPLEEKLVVGSDVLEVLEERLVEFPPDVFQEKLIPSLLRGMGFEAEASPTYTGDGGLDVSGTFRMGVFTGDVRVQVKRVSGTIPPSEIRELRGSLKHSQQGVFITTSSFTSAAIEEAEEVERIGGRIFLVNGRRLAELILDTYDDLEKETAEELEEKFGLQKSFTILKRNT